MKRYNFTINEMLAVIALIMILSALVFPAVTASRAQARLAGCAANQGQTMKMLQDGMARAKDQLISASADSGSGASKKSLWVTSLYERNILKSMDGVRCPELNYATTGKDISNDDHRKEAYGVVYATDGKLDFRGSKLRKSGSTDVAPGNLLIGGCAADNYKDANAKAVLDFSGGYLVAVHRNQVNVFFLDGAVATIPAGDFAARANTIYYPKADNTGAAKMAAGNLKKK